MLKRFRGQFHALGQIGSDYCNQQRFWPLSGEGKPLWEFKEHDHRLYCFRKITGLTTKTISVVLFGGWIKDKRGKTEEEKQKVRTAISIYKEFSQEYPGFEG